MINAYKVAGDRLVAVETIQDLDLSADTGWIDLSTPTAEEDRLVEEFLQISIPTKEDMQEIELSNRLYIEDGVQYMTMMAVSLVRPDNPLRCPITFILHDKILVTVRYEDFLSVSYYLQAAKKKNGVPMPGAQGIMLSLIESFINRIADALETVGGEIDGISHDIFRSKKILPARRNKVMQLSIRKIGEKGDFIGMVQESLSSISRLMIHHTANLPDGAGKSVRSRINSLSRDIMALNDHAGFLNNKMGFLLDATLGMINLEQNQIIKIFSIAAVVFLPPTLVASVYGMNFHHMPELDWPFGYPMALLGMLVSALVPLLYFKKKGWL